MKRSSPFKSRLHRWVRPGSFRRRRKQTSLLGAFGRRATLELLEARRLLAGDTFEPNNSFGAAADLGTGDFLHEGLEISPAGDEDFFKWEASGDGTLIVDALFLDSQGDLDLRVYDSMFNELGASVSQTDNEQVVVEVTNGESYFIRTYEFTAANTIPDYDLKLTEILPDAVESNDTSATATPITARSTI